MAEAKAETEIVELKKIKLTMSTEEVDALRAVLSRVFGTSESPGKHTMSVMYALSKAGAHPWDTPGHPSEQIKKYASRLGSEIHFRDYSDLSGK